MPALQDFDFNNSKDGLSNSEKFSVFYHDIFDYPLKSSEILDWIPINPPEVKKRISRYEKFYVIEGRDALIYKRNLQERYSLQKRKLAIKAANVLGKIPWILMIGLTGSVAMNNAKKEGDIDLLIITKSGFLWTTRLVSYLVLILFGIKTRKPRKKDEKDRLCLNMWFDESDLVWKPTKRNFYTAHEILQITPLVNRAKTYEEFLYKNNWVSNYWVNKKLKNDYKNLNHPAVGKQSIFEKISYMLQKKYMDSKKTIEHVSPTRAIFHPNDLSKVVLDRINKAQLK